MSQSQAPAVRRTHSRQHVASSACRIDPHGRFVGSLFVIFLFIAFLEIQLINKLKVYESTYTSIKMISHIESKISSLLNILKVNLEKSTLFGINVDLDQLDRLVVALDCGVSDWPIPYFGLPLEWNPKVGFEEHKRDHIVSWDLVCKAKGEGGLGFGKTLVRNRALLGKWLWRFPEERYTLWHQVTLTIYRTRTNGWDANMIVRCFLCLSEVETVDHLLLHCVKTRVLWNLLFSLFGVAWILSYSVKETLLGWHGAFLGKARKKAWQMVPLCIFWVSIVLSLSSLRTVGIFECRWRILEDFSYPVANKERGPWKHIKQEEDDITICECKYNTNDPDSACGERCLNVLTSIECTPHYCPCSVHCKNQRFQKHEYAKTKLFRTEGRGWGLLANEDIKAGRFIIEYCGEVISWNEARERSLAYASQGINDAYIISLNARECIDATKSGSQARFINHSCEPNCETRKWSVLGEVRIGIFAMRDISIGTELTYDYNFQWYGGAKVHCLCGATSCCGFLGAKSRGFQDTDVWEDIDER
ncbi:Histone-lysine N-methyltransferase ASHH1 [Vitis vinifera]|uniref:Histone-lysine N-methyltransferase ASHH1 n=1 Tax=Vitis vinifera TaxID=29760 RepID=A0A438JWD9_VITVI|nr:Histone-lysine N-methyltransferase ASHH1 [Vitis vinifera]